MKERESRERERERERKKERKKLNILLVQTYSDCSAVRDPEVRARSKRTLEANKIGCFIITQQMIIIIETKQLLIPRSK